MKVRDNQSLLDIALQVSGTIEDVFTLAELNDVSITDKLTVGKTILHGQPMAVDITNYYSNRSIIPATEITEDVTREGIEFWGIEIDFIVN